MNKWKIAFWVCLIFSVIVFGLMTYLLLDQSVSLTYQKEGYTHTESDFNQIIEIVNKTDFTRAEIQDELRSHRLYKYMDFNSDTIELERTLLIFNNNKLESISSKW